MKQIWEDFDGNVRATLPLLENEIRGVDSLSKFVKHVFV
jgi:hypothetical protein